IGTLEKTGSIADYTHIWWDIRLHPRLGTVEIRICDAVTRMEEAVALAAFCQALVKHYCERYQRGEEIPSYHRILTSENKWLCARYGLEAPVMDLATGRRNRVPVAQLIRRTPQEIAEPRDDDRVAAQPDQRQRAEDEPQTREPPEAGGPRRELRQQAREEEGHLRVADVADEAAAVRDRPREPAGAVPGRRVLS